MNELESKLAIVWHQCLTLLKEQVSEQEFNAWLRSLTPVMVDGNIEIIANNKLIREFVSTRYWVKIKDILHELSGGLAITLGNAKTAKTLELQDSFTNHSKHMNLTLGALHSQEHLLATSLTATSLINKFSHKISNSNFSNLTKGPNKGILQQLHFSTKLNKEYTFNTLVKGNSNQLAYAIGMHVTQDPGNRNHNPLFIYGGVGLGKTHLMQSIGNEIHHKNPNAKIRYLHANDYIQDVVKASMRQGFDELKNYYHGLDLLIMDDIQFLAGDKAKTQEEFFYTFNNLLDKRKQVIMTCDTYPKNINNLNERLISRFTSGLTVEIQPPELEMRVAILKNKALRNNTDLKDDIAFFIAQNIKSNVRELEGALNKVIYHAKFSQKGLSVAIAKEALMDILNNAAKNISIDEIQKIVCDFYKIKISDLLSSKRTQSISRPRQIAMTISKELTQYSLPAIGEAFGGRDHTTVFHAQKTIKVLRTQDEKMERDYMLLVQMLQN